MAGLQSAVNVLLLMQTIRTLQAPLLGAPSRWVLVYVRLD